MSVNSMILAACPACLTVDGAEGVSQKASENSIIISIPSMHCAACMSRIEEALGRLDAVNSARVNLSLKRVMIDARSGFDADVFIPVIESLGFEAYEMDSSMIEVQLDQTGHEYLLRLGVAGFAMMNVMLLSISIWTGADDSTRDLLHWVSAFIAIPAVSYAAQPFFQSAWSALKNRSLNMDVPISLAIILALAMSVYETSIRGEHAYFDAAISLTFFLLIGRYLDYRTRSMARSAAQELAALESKKATRIEHGQDCIVNVAELRIGDHLRVLPGARLPVDGRILEGQSDIDTSFVSGESLPIVAAAGDLVRAGMQNLTGMMIVEATAVGADTSLQQISKLVSIAENGRNVYTSLADRAARIYAPVVHLLALVAFVAWLFIGGDWHFAMTVAIAVLVITCPCALGLAVPSVNTASSGKLFQKGVLLKSDTALERLAQIDTVVFDKTGTLTTGEAELVGRQGGLEDLALAMAQHSSHPLAMALRVALEREGIVAEPVSRVSEEAGRGVRGTYCGKSVKFGRAEWVGAPQDGEQSEIWLSYDGRLARFTFRDHLRPNVEATISKLKKRGLRVVMLSGDRDALVHSMAERLGIKEYRSQILPEEKLNFVHDLKSQGAKILMVGDGLNDTAALTEANVSMAPGKAVEITRMASDIVFMNNDFKVVYESYDIAVSARRRILENFGMAASYNLVAIPIALLGFATPFLAALAMSISSICVVLNANRIRWKK